MKEFDNSWEILICVVISIKYLYFIVIIILFIIFFLSRQVHKKKQSFVIIISKKSLSRYIIFNKVLCRKKLMCENKYDGLLNKNKSNLNINFLYLMMLENLQKYKENLKNNIID